MEKYAGRLLADRYRLPQTPSDEFEFVESWAFDTASGHEVLVRQVPLPEVVDAELVDGEGRRGGSFGAGRGASEWATRTPDDPVVRRAVEAARTAAELPDHPRLDQVFDVFVQGDGLWIVSELVPARPLAALLAEESLGPYRAAEVAADLLAALRIVHAHGWTHRNVTARTVLICDDGRAVLTGLAAGAAEEVLCGYDPLPASDIPDTFAAHPAPRAPAPAEVPRAPAPAAPRPPETPRLAARERVVEQATEEPEGPVDGPAPPDPSVAPTGARPWDASDEGALERRPGEGEPRGPAISTGYGAAYPPPAGPQPGAPAGAGYWGEAEQQPQWPAGFARDEAPPGLDATAAQVREQSGLPPGFEPEHPPTGGELPEGYQRWDGGAPPGGPSGVPAPRPEQGRDQLPSSWDFEGGAGGQERGGPHSVGGPAPQPPAGHVQEPPTPHSQTGYDERAQHVDRAERVERAERAARSGAIAAYRAGARAGAARRANMSARPPGVSPTDLPGARRPSPPVRTGWELTESARSTPADGGGEPLAIEGAPVEGSAPAGEPLPRQGARPSEGALLPRDGGQEQPPLPASPGPEAAPPAVYQEEEPAPPTELAAAGAPRYRGPDSALGAERARQARMHTVGAVTERWAPEQAGPVYEHWRLAPPVGPAADFWALGALLFRAVQGYPAYPEDSATELVQSVCAEQPAFAEDCGALRPIVESLLRQDPTERPSAEALRGWLRSLLRGAPEPDVGRRTVTVPPPALEPGRPADPRRLPILRRRGELVGPRRRPRGERGPRRLGKALLVLVLLGLAGAIAYVLAFAPGSDGGDSATGEGSDPDAAAPPGEGDASQDPGDDAPGGGAENEGEDAGAEPSEGATQPSPAEGDQQPAPPPEGFEVVEDPAGFALVVPTGWQRQGPNDQGQIAYTDGESRIVVVAARDSVEDFGEQPREYLLGDLPESEEFWADRYREQNGVMETRLGNVQMAEVTFRWREGEQRLMAHTRVLLIATDYHVIQVRGPADQEDQLRDIYDATKDAYSPAG
ncbi:serine/threonine protein kinase [Streptomyces profundus]|uniref:serine/threonine protein kinase n=1 Tax=Streptomyces profundus TaxID=2867410 RepID=UPI001D16C8AE|nr:serine/threonine protein kinase [Streptomyces sp. MA3_2.13]UED84576.1 serine/threonine protein kinase [Streptomyces sp. MA3_2.13]